MQPVLIALQLLTPVGGNGRDSGNTQVAGPGDVKLEAGSVVPLPRLEGIDPISIMKTAQSNIYNMQRCVRTLAAALLV